MSIDITQTDPGQASGDEVARVRSFDGPQPYPSPSLKH